MTFVSLILLSLVVQFPGHAGMTHAASPALRPMDHAGSQAITVSTDNSSEVNLKIRGVGLGSDYNDVRRRLGAPIKRRVEKIDDTTCGDPYRDLYLSYKGLTIRLEKSASDKAFTVVSLEVTSAVWTIQSNIRVGVGREAVIKSLGAPSEEGDQDGFHLLHYTNKGNDGAAVFYFKNDRLAKIAWESALC